MPSQVRQSSGRIKQVQQSRRVEEQNERRRASVENECPYGCADDELIEGGFCRHLVGFTNDPSTMRMEVRCVKLGKLNAKTQERRGLGVGLENTRALAGPLGQIRPTDIVVEMPGTSYRVYREDGDAPLGKANLEAWRRQREEAEFEQIEEEPEEEIVE